MAGLDLIMLFIETGGNGDTLHKWGDSIYQPVSPPVPRIKYKLSINWTLRNALTLAVLTNVWLKDAKLCLHHFNPLKIF